ncbi:helix-turn-helix transcriptional regulator [Agromyces sp. SYSU K20354]|uniref:helix-turn-helix domain-containing protein n=1 Tax=Agromyces cavernae TaxID=2898659 RepID=UPI001E5C8CDE|nr:helix-turn-helix transcriptional regulator [Agromyces cavernae]MCD2443304.1 helix-turn-helix transcriptional regulator [Agromyces cavernae]
MTSSSALDAGRAAAADRRWAEAYEQLATADASSGLAATDLELLATAAFLRGEAGAAVDALTRAHSVSVASHDLEGAARTAAWLALYLIELGDMAHYVEWLPRGIRLAEGVEHPSSVTGLVRVPPAIAQLASGDPSGAAERFREIEAIAERFGDGELAAIAVFSRGNCLVEMGEDAPAFACFDAAVEAVARGDVGPIPSGVILCTVVVTALMGFDFDRAVAWSRALDDWCRQQPDLVTYSGQRYALRSSLLVLQGAWSEASSAADLAMSRLRAGDYRAVFGAPYYHGEVQRLRGATHAAEESYRRAGETVWDPQPGLALLHLAQGKGTRAREEILRSASAADVFTRRSLLPAVVEIEVTAGDPGAARRTLRELTTLGGPIPTPMLSAAIAFADAQVRFAEGDAAGALVSARASVEGWRALGVPYETARGRVLVGRALGALGEADQGRAELDGARGVFASLGANPALAELEDLIGDRRAGVLTPREVEVLRLVSTGLTNRAIGERLSLSEKTVARHVSNIFGKLSLSTRAAATAYAYENGLV